MLIVKITSQGITTTRIVPVIISSREVSREAVRNGSIIPRTGKELPTGIMQRLRSSTGPVQLMRQDLERTSGVVLKEEDRTYRVEQPARQEGRICQASGVTPFQVWIVVAVRRVTSAAGGNRAVKACQEAVEDSAVALAAAADLVAVHVAAVVAHPVFEGVGGARRRGAADGT